MRRTSPTSSGSAPRSCAAFSHDYVLVALVIWAFSFASSAQAQSNSQELHNASIAIVDEDNPSFRAGLPTPSCRLLSSRRSRSLERDIDPLMNTGKFTFVIDIPPEFSARRAGGRQPGDPGQRRCDRDGAGGARRRLHPADHRDGDRRFSVPFRRAPLSPVNLDVRIAFNPNVTTAWFTSVMGIINNVTMLAIILAGAAIVREREHGTMDHLLVMPLTPFEIAMSKVWANGLVITVAVGLSLTSSCVGCWHSDRRFGAVCSWPAS